MRFVTAASERIRRIPYGFWAQFLTACIVALFLERGADWLMRKDAKETSQEAQSVFDISAVYQNLVTVGPRPPISHYTALVEIDPAHDPLAVGFSSGCRQRAFLASLLESVANAKPPVIVLDKYFGSSRCSGDKREQTDTDQLKDVLSRLAPQVTVVSGVNALSDEGPDLTLVPTGSASLFRLAVVNLDRDTRRLPLHWKVSREISDRTNQGWSLALQAAQAFDRDILEKNLRLDNMVDLHENPFISFLRTDQFPHYYAGEVLCSSQAYKDDERCNKLPHRASGPPPLEDLSRRIVVIGERAEREDNHNSIIGEVPGFYLQANYIEALLDNRLFRPVHPLINYVIGLGIFAAFEFILLTCSKKWWLALILIAALLGGTAFVLYLAVTNLGYYLNPATVSLVAIGIALGHLIISRFEGHGESEKEMSHHEA